MPLGQLTVLFTTSIFGRHRDRPQAFHIYRLRTFSPDMQALTGFFRCIITQIIGFLDEIFQKYCYYFDVCVRL
jgi:hypothetical protein